MPYRYNAFISYNQISDKKLATSLQSSLRTLGAKKHLLKFRALEIFRDETDSIGSLGLKEKIENGLDQSEYLVLLANPSIARLSTKKNINWVEEEIKYWLLAKDKVENNPSFENPNIIICLTAGVIKWDYVLNDFDWEVTNCLPISLKGVFKSVPLWIDLIDIKAKESEHPGVSSLDYPEFKKKVAELSSQIQGISVDNLISKDLQNKRIWTLVLSLASLLLVAMSIISILFAIRSNKNSLIAEERTIYAGKKAQEALKSANLARQERQIAVERQKEAESEKERAKNATIYAKIKQKEAEDKARESFERLIQVNNLNAKTYFNNGEYTNSLLWSAEVLNLLENNPKYKIKPNKSDYIKFNSILQSSPQIIHLLNYRNGSISNALFSNNGKSVITGQENSTITYHNLEDNKSIFLPRKLSKRRINSISFSKNKLNLLLSTEDGIVYLINANSGDELLKIIENETITKSTISPDGKKIIVAFRNGLVKIYDTYSKSLAYPPLKHDDEVTHIVVSPNNKYLATASLDKSVRIWNLDTGELLHKPIKVKNSDGYISVMPGMFHRTVEDTNAFIKDIYFSSIEDIIFICADRNVRSYNLKDFHMLNDKIEHFKEIEVMNVSNNKKLILTASYDKTVKLWNSNTGALLLNIPIEDQVNNLKFNYNDSLFCITTRSGYVYFYKTYTSEKLTSVLPLNEQVVSVDFDGSNNILLATKKSIEIFALPKFFNETKLSNTSNYITSATLSKDLTMYVTNYNDSLAYINYSFSPKYSIINTHLKTVNKFNFSPNLRTLLASNYEGVSLIDLISNKVIFSKSLPILNRPNIYTHPLNNYFIIGDENSFEIFDFYSGKSISGHINTPNCILDNNSIAFDKNNRIFISYCSLNPQTQQSLINMHSFNEPKKNIYKSINFKGFIGNLQFFNKKDEILFSSGNKIYYLNIKLNKRKEIKLLDEISQILYNEDKNNLLVTYGALVGSPSFAQIFTIEGVPLSPIVRHEDLINMVRLSKSGTIAATASYDNYLKVWDTVSGLMLIPPFKLPGNALDAKFSLKEDTLKIITSNNYIITIAIDNLKRNIKEIRSYSEMLSREKIDHKTYNLVPVDNNQVIKNISNLNKNTKNKTSVFYY